VSRPVSELERPNTVAEPTAQSGHPIPGDPVLLDFRGFLSVLRRQARLVQAVTLACLALALGYLLLVPPQFLATARVLIDTRGQKVLNVEDVVPGVGSESSTIETYVGILGSRRIAERVIEVPGSSAPATAHPGIGDKVRAATRNVAQAIGLASTPQTPSGSSRDLMLKEAAVRDLMRHLVVERIGLSYLVDVSYPDPDPVRAARTANSIVDAFLADQVESRAGLIGQASQWMNGRVLELNVKLREADDQIQQLKAQSESPRSRIETSDTRPELSQARTRAAQAKARLDQIQQLAKRPNKLEGLALIADAAVVNEFRQRYAELERRTRASARQSARMARSNDSWTRLASDIDRAFATLEQRASGEVNSSNAVLASLEQNQNTPMQKQAEDLVPSARLTELEAEANAIRELHASLLKRLKELQLQQTLVVPEARVVAYASPPLDPASPKPGLTLVAGLVAGVLVGIIAALARDSVARFSSETGASSGPRSHSDPTDT
jgi:polysaccharide biosynthesis transport protein